MPKRAVDVGNAELAMFYRLTRDYVQPVSMRVRSLCRGIGRLAYPVFALSVSPVFLSVTVCCVKLLNARS